MNQEPMKERTYLYRADCMKGRVFDAQSDEFEGLGEQGWVDSPAKVNAPTPEAPKVVLTAVPKFEEPPAKTEEPPGSSSTLMNNPNRSAAAPTSFVEAVIKDGAKAAPVVEAKAKIDEAAKSISDLESHRSLLSKFAEAGEVMTLDEMLELARLQGVKGLTRRNSLANIETAILDSMKEEPDVDNEKSD